MDLRPYQLHALLRDFPPAQLEALVQLCETVHLPSDATLLAPGQENHTVFFLLAGRIRVHLDARNSVSALQVEPGEVVGEMSVIERRPAAAWVVAEEASDLLAMPEDVFWGRYCAWPPATRTLLGFLIARVRSTNGILQREFERRMHFEVLQRELESAGTIQASILPTARPLFRDPRVDVEAAIRPARAVGGDFYDAILLGDGRLCVAVGDVSGKGLPAALFMVRVITLFRLCLLQEQDPGRVLPELNRQLCEANDECMFVTLAAAILNPRTGRVTYLNAGHNGPYLSRAGGLYEAWDPPPGVLLGVAPAGAFAVRELVLAAGDTMVLYTDGVTEAENLAKELFGPDRARQALSQSRVGDAVSIVAGLEQAIASFVDGAPQSDDITVLALRYRGASTEP